MANKYRCNNQKCGRPFELDFDGECPVCRIGTVVPQSFLNQQERKVTKKVTTEKYLAAAKQEIRRLEKGIDKILYLLDTEYIGEEEVIKQIHNKLHDLYNGKEIN